ncbi:hypothetical protein V8E51_007558 [Hyaloscypha variabilis]
MEQDPPEETESTLLDNDEPSRNARPGDRSSSTRYGAQAPSSRRQRRSEPKSYPTRWSKWEWSEEYNRYSRYRQVAPDAWEWGYDEPQVALSTTEAAPIPQPTTFNSQPISLGSSARPPDAVDGIAEGLAQSTLNSLHSAQQHHIGTIDPYTDRTDRFDPHYKVHSSWSFKVGNVFKIWWSEPRGAEPVSVSVSDSSPVSGGRTTPSALRKAEEGSFRRIRRFVIVNAMEGHCICLPILTYSGTGTKKRGVNANTHAIIYTGKTPVAFRGENITRKSIRVSPSSPLHKLDDASRLDYARVYTVEYNVKVWFIGEVHDDSIQELMKNFAEVQSLRVTFEPLPNTESSFPSARKILDSTYQMANRKFFKKGRVFSTPHPEVAGPLTTESNEITLDPYHNKLHTKIRRCIVVRDLPSHCLCVPVNTYGGRDNYTAKPQDQYQLFPAAGTWDKSRIAKKELPLVVETSDVDVDYNLASVDFTRILTIKHYVLVKKIGRIDKLGLPLLEECFRNALGVPLELDDTNLTLHPKPTFVSMFSPTHLKWYGLIAGVHGDYEENFISRNVVDRLRLPYASVPAPSWANGSETPSVTATFTVARDQVSHYYPFHVVDNLDYDVCFGRAYVQATRNQYPQFYNMMYPSDGSLPPPEGSTDGSLLSPPSHSLKLSRGPESLPGYNMPASSSPVIYNQHQNAGIYENAEDPPYEKGPYNQEPPSEETWQEAHQHGHAPNPNGLASSAQVDDIYDA